jgi:hypothetical protein
MFGYTTVDKPELKFKEYDLYHSYYCGLCTVLRKRYGIMGEFTLSYDGAFLCALLSDLYDEVDVVSARRCAMHPIGKHAIRTNAVTDYAADMNVLMAMYKCRDDWHDDRKLGRKIIADILEHKTGKTRKEYESKVEVIVKSMKDMDEIEATGKPEPERMAEIFGRSMAEVYVYRHDEWEKYLRTFGDHLGRAIYFMDAYEDIYSDLKKKRYNPFSDIYTRPDFEGIARQMVTAELQEACIAFEKLPLIENVDILRNILYSGIWMRFNIVAAKRSGSQNTEGEPAGDGQALNLAGTDGMMTDSVSEGSEDRKEAEDDGSL